MNKLGIFTVIIPIAVGVALMTATTAPASAQPVVVVEQGISTGFGQSYSAAPFVYGSPIPSQSYNADPSVYGSPILTPSPINSPNGFSSTTYYSHPVRRTVVNSTLINPVLVNPTIRDSTLINPVIVNEPEYQRPILRRSRMTLSYP